MKKRCLLSLSQKQWEKSWEWRIFCHDSAKKGSSTYQTLCDREGGISANMETLVAINHIKPLMIHSQEGECVSVCLCSWVCGFHVLLYNSFNCPWCLSDLKGILCRLLNRLRLGICEISLKWRNISSCQLSLSINLCCHTCIFTDLESKHF